MYSQCLDLQNFCNFLWSPLLPAFWSFLLGLLSLVCPLMNIYLLVVNSFFKSELYLFFQFLHCLSENVFVLLSPLKCCFTEFGVDGNVLLIFWSTFQCLLTSAVAIEKSAVSQNVISLKINLSFLLLNFKIPSFSDVRNFHSRVT